MPWRLAFILTLSLVVITYRGFGLWEELLGPSAPGTLGMEMRVRGGRLAIETVGRKGLDDRASPAWAAGVRPGDRLIAVENAAGQHFDIDSLAAYGDALRTIDRDASWVAVMDRGDAPGVERLRLTIPRQRLSPLIVFGKALAGGLVPLLAVATALLVILIKPNDGHAFLGALLFLGFSSVFGVPFWTLPTGLREVAGFVHHVLITTVGYVFMRFFLLFPSPVPLDRRVPWLKNLLLVPVAYIALMNGIATVAAFVSLAWGERILARGDPPWMLPVFLNLTLAMFVVGVGSLGWQRLNARTPGERRRVGVLLAGALAGLLPFVIVIIVAASGSGEQQVPVWVVMCTAVLLPLFPLSFVYAVVRHRVLGVQLIVRRGIRYALLSRGFLAIEAALLFGILLYGLGRWLPWLFPDSGTGTMMTTSVVFTLVAAVGVRRLNRRLRPVLDRRFFRDPYDPQLVLSGLIGAIREHVADPVQLVAAVARTVATALHPRHVAVFLDRGLGVPDARGPDANKGGQPYRCIHLLLLDPTSGRPRESPHISALWRIDHDGPFASVLRSKLADGVETLEVDEGDPRSWFRRLGLGRGADREESWTLGRDRDVLGEIGAVVVVPLATHEGLRGWLTLGDKLSEESYTSEDKALLKAVAEQTAIALDYAQLVGRAAEQEAMRREMEIAREVQAGLFPRRRPIVSGLDYDGVCLTAREVGGDSFDFLDLGAGRLGVTVADIAGKGVSAALLMASLQAMLRSRAPQQVDDPAALVAGVNAMLSATTDRNKFATLFYGNYDAAGRCLSYVNAGHNPPLLYRAGREDALRLEPTGMALGLTADAAYTAARCRLDPGDLLVIFTDGITEAFDAGGEEFGDDRLETAIRRVRDQPASGIQREVLREVADFAGAASQSDDMTLVVVRAVSE
jgi:sigma-B regulation protein RsbU (phosphoserine phosphatase)